MRVSQAAPVLHPVEITLANIPWDTPEGLTSPFPSLTAQCEEARARVQ